MNRTGRPRREGAEPRQNFAWGDDIIDQDRQFWLMMANIQALSESVQTLINQQQQQMHSPLMHQP